MGHSVAKDVTVVKFTARKSRSNANGLQSPMVKPSWINIKVTRPLEQPSAVSTDSKDKSSMLQLIKSITKCSRWQDALELAPESICINTQLCTLLSESNN